jgi:hypothetical protein
MTVLFHGLIAFKEVEGLTPQTHGQLQGRRQMPNVERQTPNVFLFDKL